MRKLKDVLNYSILSSVGVGEGSQTITMYSIKDDLKSVNLSEYECFSNEKIGLQNSPRSTNAYAITLNDDFVETEKLNSSSSNKIILVIEEEDEVDGDGNDEYRRHIKWYASSNLSMSESLESLSLH